MHTFNSRALYFGPYRRASRRISLGLVFGLSLSGVAALTGCHGSSPAQTAQDSNGQDPADINSAQVGNTDTQNGAPVPAAAQPRAAVMGARSAYTPQQGSEQYAPQAAQAPSPDQYAAQQGNDQGDDYNAPNYDQNYDQSQVDAGQQAIEQASEPPPPMPVYDQPMIPGPNYIWTPGYWSWGGGGYYWVPGAWCAPPFYGALWTPGYWGFFNSVYVFHRGYWGPHIGFYGGVNYGFGYTGYGYHGGYWNGNNFYYNRSVNNINVSRVTNVYNHTVIVNNSSRVSYNGGRGGINVRPQASEMAAMRGPRVGPMNTQVAHAREAAQDPAQRFSANRGRPAIVAAPRPIAAQQGIRQPAGFQNSRPAAPALRPAVENRPGQPAGNRPGEPANRPGQPAVNRPNQPENRPGQAANRPAQPENRPQVQPQNRPAQTQPQNRSAQPQQRPEQANRPAERPQTQNRPAQSQPQPQARPQPEQRPAPQPQARPTPQPQSRPTPQPQSRPAPQPQSRPTPQPQSRPAPQPHGGGGQAPHGGDEHGHGR